MKLKIDKHLALTEQETHLVLMHSILNILGVLIYNVKELGKMSRNPEIMKPVINTLTSIREKLDDQDFTYGQLSKFDELHEYLSKSFVVIYESYPDLKDDEDYKDEVDNIYSVLSEMRRRAEEIVEWDGDPFRVKKISTSELREDMEQFFEAVQRNSQGAYKVVFSNDDLTTKMTYLMDFEISVDNDEIEIPMVFKDVIRDVLANARKYSLPGSKVEATFIQKDGQTRFSCTDEGVGIPEEELPKVTEITPQLLRDVVSLGKSYTFTHRLSGFT
ncbi:MAG: hypothetical protein RIF33_01835, partial [Cyclobacteriaceae bacterium]